MYTRMHVNVHAKLLPSCPTLCNPVECSPPGSSVHGILQARMLEWVAISFSKNPPSTLQSLNKNSASAVAARRGLIREKGVGDLVTAKDSAQRTT